MKRNNKILIIIGVLLMNVFVLYMIGQSFLGGTSEYEKALAEARTYAEKELCSKAIDKYNDAIAIKDTLDVRIEMIGVYEKGMNIGEFVNTYDIFNAVKYITEDYREDAAAYEQACDFFLRYGKYDECATALMQARELKVTSDKISEQREQVRYKYERRYSMYETVLPCFDGYFAVSAEGEYSYLDEEASPCSDGAYTYLSSVSEGYAFAKATHPDGTEKSFIIDTEEQRQVYIDGAESSSGIGAGVDADGERVLLLSCRIGDRYKYFRADGGEAFGDYVFAGRFRNNVAAVKDGENSWRLINGTGNAVTETVFTDVVLNEFDECAPKGIIIADDGSGYRLYSHEGKPIGDFTCDGAKAFVDGLAAFKSGDKWGFVDAEGNIVISAQYDDARSFSNGMGAVKNGEDWSFINSKNETVIEEKFEDVGYLNAEGVCFVKIDGYWSELEFYYTGE